MIQAVFAKSPRGFAGVEVSGHAGFAEAGADIVCASVTSAVQLTANGITEVLKIPAQVEVLEENRIVVCLPQDCEAGGWQMMEALHLHLQVLAQEYEDYITITEV